MKKYYYYINKYAHKISAYTTSSRDKQQYRLIILIFLVIYRTIKIIATEVN